MRKEHAALAIIRVSRRLFSHTRVHAWPITGYLYRKVFGLVAPGGDRTSDYLGVTLTYPTEDSAIAAGLVGGYYERQELTLYSRLAGVSKTVLDAGGNIGIYACIGAAQLPPGGRLVTFEPVPQNLAYGRRNLDQNGLTDRVEVVQTALGPEPGTVVIHLAAGGFTGSHSVARATVGADSSGSLTVPMTTIDDYVSQHGLSPVDLIKVDVEGFDIAVLRGALRTLRTDQPTLLVEYAPALLRNAGYDPVDLLEIIFSNYEHVLLIDEPRNVVRAVERDELAAMADRKNLVNLVAINRSDHLALCQEPL